MSGGFFGYQHQVVDSLANDLEAIVAKEGWIDDEFAEAHAYDLLHDFDGPYRKIVINEMKDLAMKLRSCAARTRSVEWLLSGDYGASTYVEQLKKQKGDENDRQCG